MVSLAAIPWWVWLLLLLGVITYGAIRVLKPTPWDLKGKLVLITGGSMGIGKSVAMVSSSSSSSE